MKDNDKDIYEMFNDIEFDEKYMSEVPLDDISKQRIKKNVLKSSRYTNKSIKKIAAVAAILLVIFIGLISPQASGVMAALKEKIFFNAGTGLVSENEEVYVLKEPISFKTDNKNVLLKSVYSKNGSVSVGLWIKNSDKKEMTREDLAPVLDIQNKSTCKIKLSNGKVVESDTGSSSGSDEHAFISRDFKLEGLEKDFTVIYRGYEQNVSLVKADSLFDFNEVGGNATNKDLLIGSTKYVFDNKTYLSFWTDSDIKKNKNDEITFCKDDIRVTGKNSGVQYNIEPSETDGQGREFYIDKVVDEPLDVTVSKVTIDYNLKNKYEMTLDLPKKGEEAAVNKTMNLDEIHEKLYIKSINRAEKNTEIHIDSLKYKKDDSLVELVSLEGDGGCTGTDGKSDIITSKENKDIPLLEKISGKYKLKVNRVMISKTGPWKFVE